METQIECKDTAYRILIDSLIKQKKKVKVIQDVHKNRHKIIQVNQERWYLIYKRDWYNSFPTYFKDFVKGNPLFNCKGESINVSSVDLAIATTCEGIVFCHKEGYYFIHTIALKNVCIRNNLVRKQDKSNIYKKEGGGIKAEQELTYSFPYVLLTELEV